MLKPLALGLLALTTIPTVGSSALAQSALPADAVWQGAYIGADGGGTWRNGNYTYLPGGPSYTSSSSGGLAGAYTGLNWQSGNWVAGLEGDWTHTFMGGTNDLNMFSGRVRTGWTAGNYLLYATAGVATENRFFHVTKTSGAVTETFTDQQQHFGLIFGGGIEAKVSKQMSVRAEGLYFIGNKRTYDYPASPPFSASSIESDFTQAVVRAGLAYHLN